MVGEGYTVDQRFDPLKLFLGDAAGVGKIKAQAVWAYIGALLDYMITKSLSQSGVKQVCGGVVPTRCGAVADIYLRAHFGAFA